MKVSSNKRIIKPDHDLKFFENDWVNFFILLIFWAILFRELLTGASWLHDDFPYVYYPGKFLAAVSLSEGVMPFWNPYSFAGMPFFADPQIAILYPFNYFLKFFVSNSYLSPLVVQVTLILHYFFASVFCYFLGKELKFNNYISLLFSLLFTYSSYMIIHMVHYNNIETVVWLPLLFLLFIRFINSGKYYYIIIAGIVMSLSILAGYPQCYFFNFIFLSIFILYHIYKSYREKDYRKIKLLVLGGVIFFVISVGIASVQLLPTNTFSENTPRLNTSYEFAKQGSIHPLDLLTMLVPKIFGTFSWNQSAGELPYWSIAKNGGHQEGGFSYTVSTLYFTLLPLIILFPLIRYYYKNKSQPIPVFFYLILALVMLLFAFGGNFFLHKLFYLYVPLFSRFRNPGHISYLIIFCVMLVSAAGFNEILKNKNLFKKYFSKYYFIVLSLIAALIFILTNVGFFKSFSSLLSNDQVYSWVTKQVNIFFVLSLGYLTVFYLYFNEKIKLGSFKIVILLLLLADIYLFAFNQNNGSISPKQLYSQQAQVINQLKEESKTEQFRIKMREGNNVLFQRYQGAIDRIQLIEGINVLTLNRYLPVNKKDSSTQYLDLLNVKYKIQADPKANAMKLVGNPGYLPRAKMFYDIKVIGDEENLKKYMESKEYDYNKTLVIEKTLLDIQLPKTDSNKINSSVNITSYGLNEIKLDAQTDENGFLFLSEVFYPDWKAYVDGKETEIFRTDYSLRSIYLEKGKHSVEFIYESKDFKLGSKITLVTLFLSLAGLAALIYFKKEKKSETG